MTIKLSENNGKTWPYAYQVYSGPSAYSDLTNLRTGISDCYMNMA